MMHIISTEEKFKIFRAAYGHIYWKIAHYYGREFCLNLEKVWVIELQNLIVIRIDRSWIDSRIIV